MSGIYILTFAVLTGILPALLWLWFWLREDNTSPEPRGLIARAFFAGVIVVPLVLPFQFLAAHYVAEYSILLFFLWAAAEEILKFGAGYIAVFHRTELDEPIDAVIYLITTALGFVAIENALFLVSPIIEQYVNNTAVNNMQQAIEVVITGNLRFIGASLLHIIASATVGVFFAFAFYKNPRVRRAYTAIGLCIAIALHTVFNFFIMDKTGEHTFIVFAILWLAIVALMLFFEKIKTFKVAP